MFGTQGKMQPKAQQSLVVPQLWGAQEEQDSTTTGTYSSGHTDRH